MHNVTTETVLQSVITFPLSFHRNALKTVKEETELNKLQHKAQINTWENSPF